MPQTSDARKSMERQALELRARAERFRTFAENARAGLRRTLLDLADESDAFAARVEAQRCDPSAPSAPGRPQRSPATETKPRVPVSADQLRDRAVHLRRLADQEHDPRLGAALRTLADRFEQYARRIDRERQAPIRRA